MELECYAVYRAFKHFRTYLGGITFELVTDCKSLVWLKSVKDDNRRLFSWSLTIKSKHLHAYVSPRVEEPSGRRSLTSPRPFHLT